MSAYSASLNKLAGPVRIVCAIMLFAMASLGMLVYGAPPYELFIMFVFALFYVQLPGLLILRALMQESERISTTLILGFFTGWAYEIALYFISDLFPSDLLLLVGGPLLSVIYIHNLVKRPDAIPVIKRVKWNRISVAFCIFFVLVFLYCIVNTQYIYLYPELSDSTYMNPDKAYHIGLISSLSHDYPLQSPWISGIFINYHIFSEILLSIPVRLFNVDPDFTTFSFGPFMTAYCFGLSLYSFFREMSSKPQRAGIYCLIVLLANPYVTRNATASLAFKFILVNDNATGYGISAFLMSIVVLKKWYDAYAADKPNRYALMALSAVFIMLTTGIKGPMGAVLIASLWGAFVLGIILRKLSFKTILPMAVYTAAFILVYYTVLGSKGQTNSSGNSLIKFGTITNIAFWKKPLIAFLNGHGIDGPAVLLIILFVFAVFFLTAFFVPFCIGYLRELYLVLSGKKPYDPIRVTVYAACAVGLVALFFLNYSGHSQVYFGFVTVMLAPIVAFWLIEELDQSKTSSRILLRVSVLSMVLVLLLTGTGLAMYYSRHIESAVKHTDPTLKHSEYTSITKEEYEAMEWIDDNTEEDALLATDRYYSVNPEKYTYQNRWDNRFFLYVVYSNRFTYISGSGYSLPESEWEIRKEMIETNNKLYDGSFEDRGELARQLDIDYVVVSKRFTEATDLSNADYELCYSNDDIDIYKVAE